MQKMSLKRIIVYLNLALLSAACWYVLAEVFLAYIWVQIWH